MRPHDGVSPTLPQTQEQMTSPQPGETIAPDKTRPQQQRAPIPSPPPMGVHGYHCDPPIIQLREGRNRGQIVVFLSKIVYEEVLRENIQFELQGKPSRHITIHNASLFEAQDLLIDIEVQPEAELGRYDARIRIGGTTFFLPDVFEVRRSALRVSLPALGLYP